MWRPETGDAAAFLINQDRCILTFDAIAELAGEAAELIRRLTIPGKQDKANGLNCSKKIFFLEREIEAATAKYHGTRLGHFICRVE